MVLVSSLHSAAVPVGAAVAAVVVGAEIGAVGTVETDAAAVAFENDEYGAVETAVWLKVCALHCSCCCCGDKKAECSLQRVVVVEESSSSALLCLLGFGRLVLAGVGFPPPVHHLMLLTI